MGKVLLFGILLMVSFLKTIGETYASPGMLPGFLTSPRLLVQVPAPLFSPDPGWYSSDLDVLIQTEDPSATILYTLDGSEPSLENIEESVSYLVNYFHHQEWTESQNIPRNNITYIYSDPVHVNNRTSENNDLSEIITSYDTSFGIYWRKPTEKTFKGQVIKAKVIKEGEESETVTATYFVHPEQSARYSLPVLSISTDAENLFGYEKGIYVQGKTYFDAGGTPSNYVDYANFGKRGIEWERPVHAEFFSTEGELEFSQNLGMRIHGGGSRSRPMKGFRLYARNDYDEQNSMVYPFFQGGTDIYGAPMDDHKHLLVRMGGDLMDVFSDAATHRIMQPAKVEVQRSLPVVHFFNGEYWGVANIRDRTNDHFLSKKYLIERDNLVILAAPWGQGNSSQVETDNPEDILLYRALYNHVTGRDMSEAENYKTFEDRVDVLSYIDYNVLFIYLSNSDWYGEKHFNYWRVKNPNDRPYQDGKWRFMVWDFDAAPHGGPEFDMLINFIHPEGGGNQFASGDPEKTAMLRSLLQNEEFKHLFLNRFADHINTIFRPERMEPILRDTYEKVRSELEEHERRWHYQWATEQKLNNYIHFAHHRPSHQFQQLCSYFNIPGTLKVTANVNDPGAGSIRINTVALNSETAGVGEAPYPWNGIYFKDVPIKLAANPHSGYEFDHWLINGVPTEEKEPEVTFSEDFTVEVFFREKEEKDHQLIHFWLFDTKVPNDTPLSQVHPHYNRLPLVPLGELIFHPAVSDYPPEEGTEGIMDRVNDPTAVNYREEANSGIPFADAEMRGIRVRNPLQVVENGEIRKGMLELKIPSSFHTDIKLTLAVSRTNNGPSVMRWEYFNSNNGDWTTEGLAENTIQLAENYQLLTIDLSEITEANDNSDLAIRFSFDGSTVTGNSGNARFNNIAVEGVPMRDEIITGLPDHLNKEKKSLINRIYPNPTPSGLKIDFSEGWENINGFEIINSQGVIVNKFGKVPDQSISVALDGLPAGAYSIKITTSQHMEVLRFIKH
ncbi:CotH kinase family protein [Negadavirga shengliensis]|uniref:CotH kinase family protein n=1 Tax=Negadavirga shengliensis TaxID=1389218 RepID=A0ABV9T1Y1_9BACT